MVKRNHFDTFYSNIGYHQAVAAIFSLPRSVFVYLASQTKVINVDVAFEAFIIWFYGISFN